MSFSPAEKLTLLMLCDVFEKVGVNDSFNPDFIRSAVQNDYLWALDWEIPGLFSERPEKDRVLSHVVDALDMWQFIEAGYARLPQIDKDRIETEVSYFGKNPKFVGWDGNNEYDEIGIARMLIDKMGRFATFAGRDLNSHAPKVGTYDRMLSVFLPIRSELASRALTADDIIAVLKQTAYPEV